MILTRYAYLERVALGVIQLPQLSIFTIERPWQPDSDPANPAGTQQRSCVQEGTYVLQAHHSARFPNVYALDNPSLHVWHHAVPEGSKGRSGILIHAGNDVSAVVGCIAVGMRCEASPYAPGGYRILDSQKALQKVRDYLGGKNVMQALQIVHGHYPMPVPAGRTSVVAQAPTAAPPASALGTGPLDPEATA